MTRYAWDGNKHLDSKNQIVNVRHGGAPRLKASLKDIVIAEYDGLDEHGKPARKKSALIAPYLESDGKHGFDTPHPMDPFDVNTYMINLIGRYFETRGREIRYDVCMHRDGYTKRRIDAKEEDRDPACAFIPTYPATH